MPDFQLKTGVKTDIYSKISMGKKVWCNLIPICVNNGNFGNV